MNHRSSLQLVFAFAIAWLATAFQTQQLEAAEPFWEHRDVPVTGLAEPKLAAFDNLMLAFVKKYNVPGASLAVARNGRMVYARGFGFADVAKQTPVDPDALFRIASISKPFTSAAIAQLVERGKLKADERPFSFLNVRAFLTPGAEPDPRLAQITLHQLLRHTGGFDRGVSFDPMFRSVRIADTLGTKPPAGPADIIRYVAGRKLDFDPGTREAYSNFGYCTLGRVIEKAAGQSYEAYVKQQVLAPLGIARMQLGHSLEKEKAPGEVRYYSARDVSVPSVFGDGTKVPVAYGGWCIEAMDAHGGWIASAPELVRFASSLADRDHCPILNRESINGLFERSKDTGYDADGKPKPAYYANGWLVRPSAGEATFWHNGLLDGTSTLLVHRADGLTWAILFNTDRRDPMGKPLSELIDPLVHPAASGIKDWPKGWSFAEPTP